METHTVLHLACITFTSSGENRAKRIKAAFERQPRAWLRRPLALFQFRSLPPARVTILPHTVAQAQLAALFQEFDGIVFFCATGTAVRLSAPFLQSLTAEPAIVVVDEGSRYAISLTAGRLGQKHDLAEMVSAILGCQPIVTTASDGSGMEAIDLFARRHGLLIENLRHAAQITTLMVEGARIQLISEAPVTLNYRHLVTDRPDACIYVTSQARIDCALPHCVLRPGNLTVGVSCRGVARDALVQAIMQVFEAHNLSLNSIRALTALESARAEAGLRDAQQIFHCELRFCDHAALKRLSATISERAPGHAPASDLSICERCACLAGGVLIVGEILLGGIGLAVTRQ